MFFTRIQLAAIAASFIAAIILTPVVRAFARRRGFVAQPKSDRWHKQPTAMLGGVAIWFSVVITYVVFTSFHLIPESTYGRTIINASTFLFLVGLVDDLIHTKPYQKLIGQIMGSALVIYYGLTLPWTRSVSINIAITIFWLIGITNAINLLDNMDGLAAGIAAIGASFLTMSFVVNGQPIEALMMAMFAAALVGFLIFNSNPASIFMGDCGSLFIGFFMASAALVNVSGGRTRSFLPVLAVPILVLFIPIFDTTFVTVLRKLSGRAASQGGRDHTSHRLVALGMSERRAVWMLYGFAALSGILAVSVREMKLDMSLAAIAAFTILLTLLGVYLAGVKVYDESEAAVALKEKPLYTFLVDVSYKRRVFEVMLDVVLIILAYWSAYAVKFGAFSNNTAWNLFLKTLPVLVFFKMASFLVLGVYRGIWRYTSVDDLITFVKAVAVGSVLSILVLLFAFRFQGYSRTVFVLDGLFMLMLLAGSRLAFRFFRKVLPVANNGDGRRVLIYGAGDGGELFLREIRNNRDWKYSPIGFLDDDPAKARKVIHGLKVLGTGVELANVCRQQNIEEVLISSSTISDARVQEMIVLCHEQDIVLKRILMQIEELT
jgi:UDP-GlcNAc:undecaprenyl-phosphate/decaprenyl-phosphate GlcNAc-1-phosphate transferase